MMVEEIWRDVMGYEGVYAISNLGRVKSIGRIIDISCNKRRSYTRRVAERLLKPGGGKYGHCQVTFWQGHEETRARVHVLVLEHFLGARPDGLYGCHWDGNPRNNRLDNLYWGTPSENSADKIRHGTHLCGEAIPWSKLSAQDVADIRSAKGLISQAQLAARYGVAQNHVSRIMNGRAWASQSGVGMAV